MELSDRVGLAVLVTTVDSATNRARTVFANTAASNLFGVGLTELLGVPFENEQIAGILFVPDELEPPMDSTTVREQQGEIQRPNGQRRSVSWTRVGVIVSGVTYTVHLVKRLERSARVEQDLLDSELRFRRLMDVAPDGMIVLRRNRIVYANQAITRIQGYSHPRQLSQLTPEFLCCSEDREAVEQRIALMTNDRSSIQTLEVRAVRRDGSMIPVELILLRTQWDDEPAVFVTVRDMSERRIVQNQLVHDDRLTAVGTLAAGVAHEINNPLAYVLLNLQYLARELPKLSEEPERVTHLSERLREARHGAERVVAIVKDLRTFSKANDDLTSPVDIHRVLASVIKVTRSRLSDGVQIVEEYTDVPPVQGNAARLEQVFLNLFINAVQALSNKVGAEKQIFVRTRCSQQQGQAYVTVEVSDTGEGMAPAVLDRVFDPFFTTKPVGLGTGLGLPICHNIVTRMGGSIQAKSTLGQGSSFFVSLPAASQSNCLVPSNVSAELGQKTPRAHILVIDDELPVATMLSRVLENENDVVLTTSAERALELLEQQQFDVIFCDLLMPKMSGMEFYGEVSRRHPNLEKRVVFMTGGAFTPRADQFLSTVSNPWLEKPFDLRAVRAILQSAMNRED
jgi:PAS domain S-box-containing protein